MSIYEIIIGTGFAWPYSEVVEAFNEQDAVDILADKLESEECGFVFSHQELFNNCETGQTVQEYAEAHNLTCCGNHGVYLELLAIKKI